MILEKIKSDLKESLREKDDLRVSTLRFLLSALHNREIEKRKDLTDEDVIAVLQKQTKERKESIEAFKKGGRDDLVQKEQAELEILNKYLPQQISEEELGKIIDEVIKESGATGPADFGKVMGGVMGRVKGRVDGSLVVEVVKKILNSKS